MNLDEFKTIVSSRIARASSEIVSQNNNSLMWEIVTLKKALISAEVLKSWVSDLRE